MAYGYDGDYAYDDYVSIDDARDESVGSEASLHWDINSAQHLTMGAEYRWHYRAAYNAIGCGWRDWRLCRAIRRGFGLRRARVSAVGAIDDARRTSGWTTTPRPEAPVTPRAALLYDPTPGTTLKLLYGRAFRAPSLYEARTECILATSGIRHSRKSGATHWSS